MKKMKKVLNNNQGMTLVEIICAIIILGIVAAMFADGMSTATKLTQKALVYKNSSAALSSSVEMGEPQEAQDKNIIAQLRYIKNTPVVLTLDDDTKVYSQGSYVIAEEAESSKGTKLKYREFLPSNYSFEVPAIPVIAGS